MRQLERMLGEDAVPRRRARVPGRARVRERIVDRPDRAPGSEDADGPGGMEPRLGRGSGPSDRRHGARARWRGANRVALAPPVRSIRERTHVDAGTRRAGGAPSGTPQSFAVVLDRPRVDIARGGRTRGAALSCCRLAADWATGSSGSTRRVVRRSSRDLHALPDALSRGAALVTLWELFEDGRVGAAAWMDLSFRHLCHGRGRATDHPRAVVRGHGVLAVPRRSRARAARAGARGADPAEDGRGAARGRRRRRGSRA